MSITIIKNADLYAPESLGLNHLLICHDKITSISKEVIELPNTIEHQVVDLAGAKLVPGFIDAHAHITGGGGEAGFATQVPVLPISEFTSAGVTTVVGLLGTDDTTRSMENMISRVYGLREEGMSAYCWSGGYHYPPKSLMETAKQDMVFLEPVIGIGEFAISDHRSSQPTYQEVIRLASEAHVAGLMTGKAGIVHFHLGDGERKLALLERAIKETEIPARVFNATHVNRNKALFDNACEIIKLGAYIDITAFPESFNKQGYHVYQAINLAVERSLPLNQITISSDGGGCLPQFDACGKLQHMEFGRAQTLPDTLYSLVQAGHSLSLALSFITSNVADLLKFSHKGKIAKNMDADLVVLDANYQVTDVMALGKWHKRDGEMCIKGTFA
ncbi:isoaspartyl dipeptidase [Marinomonas sp. SBI22]|uniref:beta-aspartyl-peptidase n=1 Tax=unclassified Marinomonas TaxID=196814 RepID=UPI0007AF6EA9|nr:MULTISPECIES: beta-aspartyl-peptidase [unclassified Marinomonas]KZM38768.1 isoaspartyl dipeptidase [Marinomonas sp. SBI8L]KZM43768.1 isoaspartyl dipeptidase [Marinomonas sp. SBI22]